MVMAAVRVDAVEGDCTRVGLERTGEAESDDRAEEMTGPFPFSCLNASGWWKPEVFKDAESADGIGVRLGDVLVDCVGVGTKLETRTDEDVGCTG